MKGLRAVIDTNVVISAALKPGGLENQIIELVIAREVALYASTAVIAEYETVFARPKFARINPARVARGLRLKSCWITLQCAKGGLARISPPLRNFVPVPFLPRPESYCLKSTTQHTSFFRLFKATTYVVTPPSVQPFEADATELQMWSGKGRPRKGPGKAGKDGRKGPERAGKAGKDSQNRRTSGRKGQSESTHIKKRPTMQTAPSP